MRDDFVGAWADENLVDLNKVAAAIDDKKLNEKLSIDIHFKNLNSRYEKNLEKINKKIRRRWFNSEKRLKKLREHKANLLIFKTYYLWIFTLVNAPPITSLSEYEPLAVPPASNSAPVAPT